MTHFYLMRHGPTHAQTLLGWRDLPADLSDIAQIARIRDYLPADALVISSDLIRSITTADAITGTRTRLPHNSALREINFGRWDGMSFDKIAQQDGDLSRAFWENPGDVQAPMGESWNMAALRASAAINELTSAYKGRSIVVVAHYGIILTILQKALSCSACDVLAHPIDNYSLTHIEHEQGVWQAHQINYLP